MKKIIYSLLIAVLCLPLAARTIYVTRHGQVGDKKCILQVDNKLKEPTLTPLGIEQAQLLANYLVKKNKFAGDIYVSPIYRTIETGTYVGKLYNKKVVLFPGIQEIARNKTPRGMTFAEIDKALPGKSIAHKTFQNDWRVSNESNEARQLRVNAALDKLLAENTKNDILFVSHGGTVGNIVRYFNTKFAKGVKRAKGIVWNCSLYKFELNDEGKVVKASYTTEYMPDEKVTSNFRMPKVPKPEDPRYETKAQVLKKSNKKGNRNDYLFLYLFNFLS